LSDESGPRSTTRLRASLSGRALRARRAAGDRRAVVVSSKLSLSPQWLAWLSRSSSSSCASEESGPRSAIWFSARSSRRRPVQRSRAAQVGDVPLARLELGQAGELDWGEVPSGLRAPGAPRARGPALAKTDPKRRSGDPQGVDGRVLRVVEHHQLLALRVPLELGGSFEEMLPSYFSPFLSSEAQTNLERGGGRSCGGGVSGPAKVTFAIAGVPKRKARISRRLERTAKKRSAPPTPGKIRTTSPK